jgi:polyketide biosynthesis enoyl-CoA hydratase PksH
VSYETIKVRFEDEICFLQFNRPQEKNTINSLLVRECDAVLSECDEKATVVVIEGLPEVFCLGADFTEMRANRRGASLQHEPELLYNLWLRLATGPFVTVSHVRGRANAGGIGFLAASDIVIAEDTSEYSLSELLFGLMPACVLPFLTRRIGFQRAHYMTLMTQAIPAHQAHSWQLVDVCEKDSGLALRKHLGRLRRLTKSSIIPYKQYISAQNDTIVTLKSSALAANRQVFSDIRNLEAIRRFDETGLLPWQGR